MGMAIKYRQALDALRTRHEFKSVLFSSYIHKLNKFNKSTLRVLLVTDRFVAKLDARKFKLLKEPAPLASVTESISRRRTLCCTSSDKIAEREQREQ